MPQPVQRHSIDVTSTAWDRARLAALMSSWRLSKSITLLTSPNINGTKFLVPVGGRCRVSLSFHEQDYLRANFSDIYIVLRHAFEKRPGAFLDIGANVGLVMCLAASLDSTRPYLGIEPNASAASLALEIINLNKLKKLRGSANRPFQQGGPGHSGRAQCR